MRTPVGNLREIFTREQRDAGQVRELEPSRREHLLPRGDRNGEQRDRNVNLPRAVRCIPPSGGAVADVAEGFRASGHAAAKRLRKGYERSLRCAERAQSGERERNRKPRVARRIVGRRHDVGNEPADEFPPLRCIVDAQKDVAADVGRRTPSQDRTLNLGEFKRLRVRAERSRHD